MSKKLLLVSQSSGRSLILNQLKIDFDTSIALIEEKQPETQLSFNKAIQLISENSKMKLNYALKIKNLWNNYNIIIAADTLIWCDEFVIGKPNSKSDAREILRNLSGREHKCITSCSFAYLTENQFLLILCHLCRKNQHFQMLITDLLNGLIF